MEMNDTMRKKLRAFLSSNGATLDQSLPNVEAKLSMLNGIGELILQLHRGQVDAPHIASCLTLLQTYVAKDVLDTDELNQSQAATEGNPTQS